MKSGKYIGLSGITIEFLKKEKSWLNEVGGLCMLNFKKKKRGGGSSETEEYLA